MRDITSNDGVHNRILTEQSKRKKQLLSLSRYLTTLVPGSSALHFQAGQAIFYQGGSAEAVYYIRRGAVKLTAVSTAGREVAVGFLNAGDFFGEGCLVGQPKHRTTARAIDLTSLLVLKRKEMIRVLHEEHGFSDRFILHMLKRKARIEEDLIVHLFNSIEKRLARALLRLASYGKKGRPDKTIPEISQTKLARMIGTNRGSVNIFMDKFRKLGYIDYDGGIRIDPSLLCVVLLD
jgi:CRP/FNR family transcriptional regulator, cyclic AMP receptor protein